MELTPNYSYRELSEEHRQALWDEAYATSFDFESHDFRYRQLVQQAIADKREAEDYKREQLFEERGY